jgi:hypothetical protein
LTPGKKSQLTQFLAKKSAQTKTLVTSFLNSPLVSRRSTQPEETTTADTQLEETTTADTQLEERTTAETSGEEFHGFETSGVFL